MTNNTNSSPSQTFIKIKKSPSIIDKNSNTSSDITSTGNIFINHKYKINNSRSSLNILRKPNKIFDMTESTIYLPQLPSVLDSKKKQEFKKSTANKKSVIINWKKRQIASKGNLLQFDKSLKILNENAVIKNNEKLKEKRVKKVIELYFDYDKKNETVISNSFSGNNPNILKNKIMFVKNVFDYIYPRIIIKRMKFLNKKKVEEIESKIDILNKKFSNNYYINKFRTPEENSRKTKYDLKGAIYDEAIKIKGDVIKLNKTIVNGKLTTKMVKNYDYMP